MRAITASMLYDLVQCPHRLALDLYGDARRRDPESKFVELLWERGTIFEREVIEKLERPFESFAGKTGEERERLTAEAMEGGAELIYGGRVRSGDLLGDPDLLARSGSGYLAGDIKSGAGEEGADDENEGKPKRHYGVQLALYTDILERTGKSAGGASRRRAFVWDVRGKEVPYDLDAPLGPVKVESLWDLYLDCLERARGIVSRKTDARPALSSACKLCHWRSLCLERLKELDDLTLLPELGRSKRDAMLPLIGSVSELAAADLGRFVRGGKTLIRGVGPATLSKFKNRAALQKDPKARPYVREAFSLPETERELFFDIETDPMRDVCYLHGFLERRKGEGERYVYFLADQPTPEKEREAFAGALAFLRTSMPAAVYFYSKYERTWWYKLRERYPDTASREEIEGAFDPSMAVDLYYEVVKRCTEWPTRDHSIKTLASYLGFRWRDPNPSGAESIEWYYRWVEGRDPSVRKRLLEYNEDDCRATRVLKDSLLVLETR